MEADHNSISEDVDMKDKVIIHQQKSPKTTTPERDLPAWNNYNAFLDELSKLNLPEVEIAFENLSYKVPIAKTEYDVPSITGSYVKFGRKLKDKIQRVIEGKKPQDNIEIVEALDNCSGVIKPGTMTLILAPPGHGKTCFLKALANRPELPKYQKGKVYYNGKTASEYSNKEVCLNKLVGMVDQADIHFPHLTVRETLEFVAANALAAEHPAGKNKVQMIIDILGMKECANTIVGNNLIRGISGGQKKRLTIAESMVSESRVLLLDEITVGLDSVSAYDTMSAFKEWAVRTKGTVVAALLQPNPEVLSLFDNLLLFRMGKIVYHGPLGVGGETVKNYFLDRGVPIPPDEDLADYIQNFLTDPFDVYRRTKDRMVAKYSNTVPAPDHMRFLNKKSPPISTDELVKEWNKTCPEKITPQATGITLTGPFNLAQYGKEFSHSWFYHFGQIFKREAMLMSRNKSYIIPRFIQATFLGLLLGSLFWNLSVDDFQDRIGLILFASVVSAFGNSLEIPIAIDAKQVILKHYRSGFYPLFPYVFSVSSLSLPVLVLESFIFGTLIYWMPSFTNDGGRYIVFILLLICCGACLSTWVRLLAYTSLTEVEAQNKSGPATSIFMLFGGFLITKDKIPDFLIWLYWLSPFSWNVKALSLTEFKASRYDAPISLGGTPIRKGDLYLKLWEMSIDTNQVWGAAIYLCALAVLFIVLSKSTLGKHIPMNTGTTRLAQDEERELKEEINEEEREKKQEGVGIELQAVKREEGAEEGADEGAAAGTPDATEDRVSHVIIPVAVGVDPQGPPEEKKEKQLSAGNYSSVLDHFGGTQGDAMDLPFQTIDLVWKDLEYDVILPNGNPKKLLRGISAYAKAGELTALMGASGAGKTTLMDVLAGRKTTGIIKGEVIVNGAQKNENLFRRVAGYVEQVDMHIPFATVKESLEFSAALRLPTSVGVEQRAKFVESVMLDLELKAIENRLVGDNTGGTPGLSAGQLKRLTIGVELVANPSILFLDEPTSGLDSREAVQVVRIIKKIARKGRTVVCTIHQPSEDVFYRFDKLLLLQSGGHQVYFGNIGPKGRNLVEYFESVSGAKFPIGANPATWMLEVLGDKDDKAGSAGSSFGVEYKARSEENAKKIEELKSKTTQFNANMSYPGLTSQYFELQKRSFRSYWRNLPFNLHRINILPMLGILFGLVFFQLDKSDIAGISSAIASMFFTLVLFGVINSGTAMPVVMRERDVFYRERFSNTYSSLPYGLVMGITEIPYLAFCAIVFLIPFYFLSGLESDGNSFFKYYLTHTMTSIIFAYWTQFLGCALPNIVTANIIQGATWSMAMLFGGVFIRAANIPIGWRWWFEINPIPKAVRAIALLQFQDNYSLITQVDGTTATARDMVADLLQDSYGSYWKWNGYLLLTIIVLRICVSLSLAFISHIKR